jgi:hypothetical protein
MTHDVIRGKKLGFAQEPEFCDVDFARPFCDLYFYLSEYMLVWFLRLQSGQEASMNSRTLLPCSLARSTPRCAAARGVERRRGFQSARSVSCGRSKVLFSARRGTGPQKPAAKFSGSQRLENNQSREGISVSASRPGRIDAATRIRGIK